MVRCAKRSLLRWASSPVFLRAVGRTRADRPGSATEDHRRVERPHRQLRANPQRTRSKWLDPQRPKGRTFQKVSASRPSSRHPHDADRLEIALAIAAAGDTVARSATADAMPRCVPTSGFRIVARDAACAEAHRYEVRPGAQHRQWIEGALIISVQGGENGASGRVSSIRPACRSSTSPEQSAALSVQQ